MLGHNVHPLDGVIDTLSKNRHLLTADHILFLKQLLPNSKAAAVSGEKSTINDLLDTLTVMSRNLKTAAEGTTDVEGFKVVIGSIEKVMNMMNKYTEQVSHEEKLRAIQDTLMETLNEMKDDALRQFFLDTWKTKIDLLAR